jgi:hypothetical protein
MWNVDKNENEKWRIKNENMRERKRNSTKRTKYATDIRKRK